MNHIHRNRSGFTYIGLMILLAIISLLSVGAIQTGAVMQRRVTEEQLLDIGREFRAAFRSYAAATPIGQSRFPTKLEDLLRDPRYPNVRRHLRKIYADPITGKADWRLINGRSGEVIGVSSASNAKPIKIGNFDSQFADFGNAVSYGDWLFLGDIDDDVRLNVSRNRPIP